MKIKTSFFIGIFLFVAISAHSTNFNYKSADDFPPLSNYESVESFEKNIQDYVQECLDRSSGGTDGMPCFIKNKILDRELNIYFNKLVSILSSKEKKLLVNAQKTLMKERDLSSIVVSKMLDSKYQDMQGTMYRLMFVADGDRLLTPIVKDRALILKRWYEYYNKQAQQ